MEKNEAREKLEDQLRIAIQSFTTTDNNTDEYIKSLILVFDAGYEDLIKLVGNKELDIYIYNTYYSKVLGQFRSIYLDSVNLSKTVKRNIFNKKIEYIGMPNFKLKVLSKVLNYVHREMSNIEQGILTI